jgi:metal-dependent HD superfamily phosphatase/phosphodiesterase
MLEITPTRNGEAELTVNLENETREITEQKADVVTSESHPANRSHIRVPARNNAKLTTVIERVNNDIELQTMWKCANINAVDRLGISDHGRVHVQIVANIGLKMLRLLREAGIEASIVKHHGLSDDDAEVVVVLGALLHDIGICVHRDEHEHHSLWLADRKVRELLDGIYDIEGRTIMLAEILHTVIAHARSQKCLTLEAGVVKVADALDMAKGRSRIPFEQGHINIHSVSAAAIESVELRKGEVKPIHVQVNMQNSSGIYQLDELLKKKIQNSTLKDFIELSAQIEAESEQKLVPIYQF